MLLVHLKEKIYMDWVGVKVMLDHTFLEDPNKLLQLINFKNILMNQKLKSKKTLLLEFLEFHEFQKLHRKPYLWRSQKPLRIQLLKIYLKVTQMEIMMKMLKRWQPQPWMFSRLLLLTKLRIFFKMNTNNFQLSTKTSQNKIKQWKEKFKISKKKQKRRQKFQMRNE